MKILVIGGSYFLGKHFVDIARDKADVTVFNRGTRPLNMENITEIHGDRNNSDDLNKLAGIDFDLVVDFCAYNAGDIAKVISALKLDSGEREKDSAHNHPEEDYGNDSGQKPKNSLTQYIFISTVDVYKKGTGRLIDEKSPLEDTIYAGEVGQYIAGKVALEKELEESCLEKGIAFTSVRPAIIYGPDNYAPREGIFFNWIDKAGQVLTPVDSTGLFQMIYVDDLARAISFMCGNEKYYNKAVNVCGDSLINYDTFFDALEKAVPKAFERIGLPVSDILERGIPLPFPLTKEESEEYCSRFKETDSFYKTELSEGLYKSYIS